MQAKRLHEYKRQLMNAMHVIALYNDLRENPDLPVQPRTFVFGAKAAPGYYFAKEIIKLIWSLGKDIEKNPKIAEKLRVVFMENYSVSMAEKMMPAAEISEQISQAGKEASGTGNMKFMINGALTVGTLDGANVEMQEACGAENIFIFGLTAEEVEELWKKGYNATEYYSRNPRLERVIDSLNRGFNGTSFSNIASYLVKGSPVADPYMCMADFGAYCDIHARAEETYRDKMKWAKMSLNNIAAAGRFSADRSVREYAEKIWGLKRIK